MIPDSLIPTRLPFALGFPPQELGDKITLSSRLRDVADGVFDGEPLILPVPLTGPAELPRIQLEARDKAWVLQLSLVRLSLEWHRKEPTAGGWSASGTRFLGILGDLLRVFVGEYVRPVRFAFNPQLFRTLAGSANAYLATRVLQPGRAEPLPYVVKIGLMDHLTLRGRPMQLGLNLVSARRQDSPGEDRGLVVQVEARTGADVPTGLTAEEILHLMAEIELWLEGRLRRALPDLVEGED